MAYVIDTYNCIHAGAALGGAFSHMTVRKLCQFIVTSPRSFKATLVMDGRKKPDEPDDTEFSSVHFRYSGTGVSADDVIAQIVERSTARKKLIVVTNDRAVALHARKNFASAMSCEAFLGELLQGQPGMKKEVGRGGGVSVQKSSGRSTRGETEHWLKEFGITPPPPPEAPPMEDVDDPDGMDIRKLLGDP